MDKPTDTMNLEELKVKYKALKDIDDIRNSFVMTTSHQLRTPLSGIKWIFSVLLTDAELKKMPDKMLLIQQAYEGVERIIDIVNDLLNVSRIREGRLPVYPRLEAIQPIIADVATERKELIVNHGLSFSAEIDKTIPPFAFDPILIREVVENLLNNAIDYNQEKGSLKIILAKKDDSVMFAVTNTGHGIAPEEKDKIFEAMYRGELARGENANGSGLGLFLSRAIIQEHGGSISFESEPGKTTTFTVILPYKTEVPPQSPDAPPAL